MTATDAQVRKLMKLVKQGSPMSMAAVKVGLDRKTARRWLRRGGLPSASRAERTWRTRSDPFDERDMLEVFARLTDAPELEAKVLFEHLCSQRVGRYEPGQLRTFQRRVERWRAQSGPPLEVSFPQQHRPGEAVQTDFTWTTELCVTICGESFPHMLCHVVLPYSDVTCATVCRSESLLALRKGIQRAVFGWGRVCEWHQTDNSTAATHRIGESERGFNEDYVALMKHLGMKPRTIEVGASEQNGDVEAANGALKRALNQHLLLRGSRDFESVEAWQGFLDDVVDRRNRQRAVRFAEDLGAMRPLSVERAPEYVEEEVRVTTWSTLRVRGNTYSVPSRLIGKVLRVRLYEDCLEAWYGGVLQLTTTRLLGSAQHAIDYRHVIWSLVRKPGAFARYRFREAMFPTLTFRRAYDALNEARGAGTKTDLQYLRLLHLAASTLESDVEAAVDVLLGEGEVPTFDAVRALVAPVAPQVPRLVAPAPDLAAYDALLVGGAP
jgi:hypothetical protein